jgi:hypothetical protein
MRDEKMSCKKNVSLSLQRMISSQKIASILIIGNALIASPGCKHRSGQSSLSSAFDENFQDSFFLNKTLIDAPDKCRAQLVNIASNSLADGLLVNGAMTGLGTDVPVGKKLLTDGAYRQALRIYSIFDWEITNRLAVVDAPLCLPKKVYLGFGAIRKTAQSALNHPYPDFVSKAKKGFSALSKDAWTFDIAEMEAHQDPGLWPRSPGGPASYQEALKEGFIAKLNHIEIATSKTTELKSKLKAMGLAYTPLGISFDATFPPENPAAGRTFLEAYLPPLAEIRTPDKEQAETWYLEKGIARRALPKPYDIGIARLTHIAYLNNLKENTQPVIKLQIFKDFAKPDLIKTHLVFGKISPDGPEKGVLPLDYRDQQTAMVVSLYPNLAEYPNDSATYRFLKQEINKVINAFRVDARIHQLALDLVRSPGSDPTGNRPDSVMLQPRFRIRDSDISFRLYIDSEKGTETSALEMIGFTCNKDAGIGTCYHDFGGYSEVEEFFGEGPKGILGSLKASVSRRYDQIVRLLTKYNAKVLINWQIAAIEEAIDQQFLEIFRAMTEDQFEAKSRIQSRIESVLFHKN